MNAEIKAHWLTELRSGTYLPNANGFLATRPTDGGPTSYSPLGVLCELAIKAGVAVTKHQNLSEWLPGQLATSYDGEAISLPPAVAQWADAPPLLWLKQDTPSRITNIAVISRENTGTFDEVAGLIDQHL
ncbi:MAG: hypothetical protein ACRYFX_19070 [Janthinobacterium lividum]